MNDFATSLACLITAYAPRPLCKTHRALEMAVLMPHSVICHVVEIISVAVV